MSEFVQKLNHKRALEGELARTISSMEEIKRVRVHIVIPEKALFKKDQRSPTASVTLHLNSTRSDNKLNIEGIQNLVASSVEGMKVEDVSVVDQRGKLLSEAPFDETTLAGKTALQHEQQRRVEQHLTSKVQSMLDNVIGTGNSNVEVNADLDFTSIEKTITDYDPERQVVRSEQNIVEKSASSDSLSYPAVNMSKDQANNIQNYEISKSVEHIVNSVGNVKRLSVAVMINGTHEVITNEQGLKELKYVPRSDEEMQQFRDLVQNAVGFAPDRGDNISVLNIPFDTSWEEDAQQIIQELPWWKIEENQKLILLGFAILLTMLIFWRVLRSKLIKERMRIALSLPADVTMGLEEIGEDEQDEEDERLDEEEQLFEELDLDEDEMMLLPAELPEQLLLEGEKLVKEKEEEMELDETEEIDSESLAARARASLEQADSPELTEETLMKIEIKQKVENYLAEDTEDAVKLIRLLLSQDLDIRGY
jgi:flagellar M-ring protein FliF